ncbi:MAG: PKD domain-containing protein [Bacteroidota bacterium]
MFKKLLLAGFIFLGIQNSFSQCSMIEVPLSQRIQNSSVIIEGRVLKTESFWNSLHTLIYTSNTIEIYKNFKSEISSVQIELITEGGTIGNKMHLVEPGLQLTEGTIGMFFIEPAKTTNPTSLNSANLQFQAYADVQGFVKYDLANNSASDPFKKYNSIENDLYNVVEKGTAHKYSVLKSIAISGLQNNSQQQLIPVINSFTPTTVTAGTSTILTIDGSGFGATQGSSVVKFKNPDDGGATYVQPAASHYVSWSDAQIQVKVPAKTNISGSAGTGTIQVIVSSITATSSGILTVNYNETNLESASVIYQTEHVNTNTNGGYTFETNTGFDANAPAKASFERALVSWRCGTYMNWKMGGTTSVNAFGNDGTNVVRFDIGSELGSGTLGKCYSYYTSCSAGVWYVDELDVVFDDGTNWNYSTNAPSGSQSDFESVALHELGHAHQLGHVINTNDVMHYSLTTGTTRRVLIANNIAAGNDVMSRSLITNICGPTPMIALTSLNCSLALPVADFIASDSIICAGDCISFTNQSTGSPSSQTWTFTGAATTSSPLENPVNICYNTAGTYTVSLVVNNGNGADTKTKTNYITVSALPATPSISQAGTVLTSSVTATSYQWSFNGGPISNETAISHTATATGNYAVTVTDAAGCSKTSSVFNFTTTGITAVNDNTVSVSIHPNPFNFSATIEIKGLTNPEGELQLFDVLGKTVLKSTITNSKSTIQKSELPAGIYIYKVFNKTELIGKGKITIN